MTSRTALSDFPFAELVGQEVTQLCLGIGQVQLHFYRPKDTRPQAWEPGARIDIEAGYKLKATERGAHRVEQRDFKEHAGNLSCLLGERVNQVRFLSENELLLSFSGGFTVRLLTDLQGFESYHLHLKRDSLTLTRHSAA